jgi:integrase
MKRDGLPRRVYAKHGRYWHVSPDGKWHALTKVKAGLPAMHRALAGLLETEVTGDRMPSVVARWADSKETAGEWEESTRRNMGRVCAHVAQAFAEFRPNQITTPVCAQYLRQFLATGRTYNLHRSVLRQVLSFAALEGLRDGHNPCDDVPQRKLAKRRRIVTDAEIAAIKTAALQATRGGPALVQMIELALLTGQRIGDLLKLRWQDVTEQGVLFDQQKTGEPLLVAWSPALRKVINACGNGRDRIGFVLVTSTGTPYRYAGIRSAWDRACARAGVEDLHIHDMRGRAGVDATEADGPHAAQRLLGHSSITMTEAYTRGKTRNKAKPAG